MQLRLVSVNSNSDTQQNPIYGLFRKHFSCSQCSPVALADFCTTVPRDQKDPYEYWLRMNRAADTAVECLKEQGKSLDNPSMEVTRMFIRNCPSKDLALTFRSKTIDKWSVHEVQDFKAKAGSRTLSHSQMNYPAHRLEFLALK